MSPITITIFAVAVTSQVAAVAIIPRTGGFTRPIPTVLCCALFIIGVGSLARLSHRGVELGILVPAMGVFIPLATIAIGIVFYGESTSPLKIALLGISCVLIGMAATRT